jgi:predicted lysophospholipase L1 biosynthesis ABC-type transport system permease subunit
MDTLRHDLIHAFRSVRKNPAYTVVTIMTLALGIGANSAIFSVVNGIHMALGASRTTVLRMVLGQGLKFTVTGLVVGVAAAFGLTRLLQAQLFNVKPTDPATIVSVAAFIAFVAMAACLIPANRAARVDPMVVLRDE